MSDQDDVRATQVKLVRWMGTGVGAFLVVVGAFFALSGLFVLGMLAFTSTEKPVPLAIVALEGGALVVGLAAAAYGVSLVRRSRRDAVVTATVTLDERVPGQRPLAWVALGFSGFMLVVTVALAAKATRAGESPLGASSGLVFVGVFLAAWRYLDRRSR